MGQVVRLMIAGQEQELGVKEYQGQRVVTFKQIDEVHKRTDGTAARNFRANRPRFIEGRDFFEIPYAELNSTNFVELPSRNGLTVITESGYMMLVKSLNDDRAWEAQRQLVDVYFHSKAQQASSPYGPMMNIGGYMVPSTMAGALRLAADQQETIEAQKAAIQIMAPKADFHDLVTAAVNCLEIGEFAKLMLGTGPNRFFKWLREQKILRADNLPRQEYIDTGRLRVEERTRVDKREQSHTYLVTVITGKGQSYLQQRWAQAGNVVQMQLANG